jgi:serine/threonine protein kinase
MSFEQKNIIKDKKSFTPKNIIHPKEKKHYLNENDNSTDSTDHLYESKALLNIDKIIGNYTLTKQIDKSSFTKIFLAKHILTGEDVTIRIINKQLFKNDLLSMTRFNKELQIIKTIKHPNIIKLIEIIETNAKIYLIFEYNPHNLLSYIQSEKKLSESKARFFFQQLISALNYLHLMGISHRNIKPENILLDEKYSIIKITGFSVSTFCKPGSLLNSPVGTIIYAPPEMILLQKYDGELNDIWDAGIVLYAMVCGTLPFSQDNHDLNINHIIEGFYDIPKDISSNCIEVIKACMETDPKNRITFDRLKNLEWVKFNNFNYVKGININKEDIIVDDIILHECKKFISENNQDILNKIRTSVVENKFDEFSSLYYLVFQKQIKKGYKSYLEIKRKKNNNNIFNYVNITNDSEENHSEKDELSNYSSHTHTNSFSSYLSYKNKMDFYKNYNQTKTYISKKHSYSRTIRNTKNHRLNITNKSSFNFKKKNYILSPKNRTSLNKQFHKKLINRFKSTELNMNKITSSPIKNNSPNTKIYTKKTHFISTPKFVYIKKKTKHKMENIFSADKIKVPEEEKYDYNNTNPNNENKNENNRIDDLKKLNTLFVNRITNDNKNYYVFHKKNNKSGEGFYLNSMGKTIYNNKTKANLISINKKNIFASINYRENIKKKKEKNEKKDINADRILMDDQPVMNFSINFNNELLLNNNKSKHQESHQDELALNYNYSESNHLNKKTFINKIKNTKSYNHFEKYYETPKKIINNNFLNYNYKYDNLRNNHFVKVKSSYKVESASSISDSFNKLMPQKKLLQPTIIRNTINDNYYNTTLYNEQKSLNKIKSFGGLRISTKKKENILQEIYDDDNTTIRNNKDKDNNYYCNNILNEKTDKKKTYNRKIKKSENKKCEVNSKTYESSNIINDIGVVDLSCLKFCIFEELIEKICKILKKNKNKFYFINKNKIHCSGKCGDFFDIEINDFKNLKNKKGMINKKKTNDNITYKNINSKKDKIDKIDSNSILQKMGHTSLGFTKNNKEKQINNKEMYFITFNYKKNDFRRNNEKLINDILY